MRFQLCTGVLAALTTSFALTAHATGGQFTPPNSNTTVTGHRVIVATSPQQSTLWDEMSWSGSPTSFAWVLPIKGGVTVGLSSDALFNELDATTRVYVGPPAGCPCVVDAGADASTPLIASATVGPYQVVQLASADPTALTNWLMANGFAIPNAVTPAITSYIQAGYDFLAIKVVPNNVQLLQPIRVTTPGGTPTAPLRIAAAGAGPILPTTVFVVGGARYDTSMVPTVAVDESKLVWDYASATSNYSVLLAQRLDAGAGGGFVVESAAPLVKGDVTSAVLGLATKDPLNSGYADNMGMNAVPMAQADLDTLFAGQTTPWITRLRAELPSTALGKDVPFVAANDQSQLPTHVAAASAINAPSCCAPNDAGIDGGGPVDASPSDAATTGLDGGSPASSTGASSGCGCRTAPTETEGGASVVALGVLALMLRRRRDRLSRAVPGVEERRNYRQIT